MVFLLVFIEHVLLEVEHFRVGSEPFVSAEILRLEQHSVLIVLQKE